MKVTAIKTRVIKTPKDNIFDIFDNLKLHENDILVIASKIISLHQGRCIPMGKIKKDDLIKKEADYYISREKVPGKAAVLTIKNSTLIASAGIDENKKAGYYILFPEKPEKIAKEICDYIKKKYQLKNMAVIIADSHTSPLRPGVTGISIGFFGLEPYKKYYDINKTELVASRVNIVDSLAAAAVFEMGEQDEQTPLAVIKEVDVCFTNKDTYQETILPIKKDIYYPLYKNFKK